MCIQNFHRVSVIHHHNIGYIYHRFSVIPHHKIGHIYHRFSVIPHHYLTQIISHENVGHINQSVSNLLRTYALFTDESVSYITANVRHVNKPVSVISHEKVGHVHQKVCVIS